MRIIKQKTLREFAEAHPDACSSLQNWTSVAKAASWGSMADVVRLAPMRPSPVGADRVVFNVCGNRYRLICAIDFRRSVIYVKWFGSHAEYDRVDAATAFLPHI